MLSRETKDNVQALYCYDKALRFEPNPVRMKKRKMCVDVIITSWCIDSCIGKKEKEIGREREERWNRREVEERERGGRGKRRETKEKVRKKERDG